jgi:hypothetical protein
MDTLLLLLLLLLLLFLERQSLERCHDQRLPIATRLLIDKDGE